MANEFDKPNDCPICNGNNNCNKNGDCWCGYEFFPKEIFDLIQEYQLGKSCICKDCLDQFKGKTKKTKSTSNTISPHCNI